MKLVELLSPGLIKVGLAATTKQAAIEELIALLVSQGAISPGEGPAVAQAVFAREASKPTGMENGVALPHGAVEGLEDLAAALGIARHGIDFHAEDGKPASLIVLLAIPQNVLQFHVKTLAGIARLLNDERLRAALAAARTPEEAFARMQSGEGDGT